MSMMKKAALTLVLVSLICAGCATTGDATDENEPTLIDADPSGRGGSVDRRKRLPPRNESSKQEEGEVPLAVAESEQPNEAPEEVVVQGRTLARHEVIHDLVAEAQTLLRDVELQYVFTGKGKKQVLRGRPVAFALWSDAKQEWSVAQIELPRPPIKWKPGRKPLPFRNLTPGIQARHVKGTGAERLMFAFSQDGNPLKVYGRKFPVFDNNLLKRRQWRAVAQTAKPIVYLPFTEDTFDPGFVSGGKEFLVATARKAIEELRLAQVPSAAFPGELLADSIPLQVITTLAVIEQTDDNDYVEKQALAFDEVLSQYGLKQEEAYRYSVSSANAIGPMQFTNRRGNGTYALVVRRCPARKARPDLRERRDESAERHESGGLPAGSRAGGDAGGHSPRVSCQPGRAGHLSGRRVQRRTPKRHEALSCPDSNEGRARRTEPPGSAARRSFGDLSLCLESGRHGCPSGGDPEIQQREPVVHRKVPEHREPVRVSGRRSVRGRGLQRRSSTAHRWTHIDRWPHIWTHIDSGCS